MAREREHDVPTPDGRTLRVLEVGSPDGPALVMHHGSPSARLLHPLERASAEARGLRLVAYDRPGYGGSTPAPGRSIADVASDVAAILDALGVERFATYGASGGGPHALACAALRPDRCAAAATLAGLGPSDAPDLDWLAGMGEGNQAEVAAARKGRDALSAYCRADAAGMLGAAPDEVVEALRPHLSDVDARALTGELAAQLLASVTEALRPGVEGWVDDGLAFIAPWGFDPERIRVPVLVLQGRDDLMVPPAHGRWLLDHVAGATGEILEHDGHFTLVVHRIGDVHDWLAERL
jgi:pimeloyl-ACP methyl ester carboxylesterase